MSDRRFRQQARVSVRSSLVLLVISILYGLSLGACALAPSEEGSGSGRDIPDKADGSESITAQVDRTWIYPGGHVTLEVSAMDTQGQPTGQWSLEVSPSDDTRVVPGGGNTALVVMEKAGIYELTVTNQLTGDRASVSVRVDDLGERSDRHAGRKRLGHGICRLDLRRRRHGEDQ